MNVAGETPGADAPAAGVVATGATGIAADAGGATLTAAVAETEVAVDAAGVE